MHSISYEKVIKPVCLPTCLLNYLPSLDPERIEKGLFTKNSPGAPLSLMHCETEVDESRKIVDEITRIIEYSHGLVKYKDIAVLVRMHYLTQNVESAFKESNIPYEIVSNPLNIFYLMILEKAS